MFDVSLFNENIGILLTALVFIFSLCFGFALGMIESWTEIPGVNEPNTYGGEEKKEDNQYLMLLSDSMHTK